MALTTRFRLPRPPRIRLRHPASRAAVKRLRHGAGRYLTLADEPTASDAQIVVLVVGSTLLIWSYTSTQLFESQPGAVVFAILGALLVVVPVIGLALMHLKRRASMLHELTVLAVLGAFASGEYRLAGAVAVATMVGVILQKLVASAVNVAQARIGTTLPEEAVLVDKDQESPTPVAGLVRGDRVLVRRGQIIPVDGRIINGSTLLDEYDATGSSAAVDKTLADPVFAGSANRQSRIEIRVRGVGEDTVMERTRQTLEQSTRTPTAMALWFRRYGAWYTPAVLLALAAVMVLDSDLDNRWRRAVTMLVAACPAALLFAAPTAARATLTRLAGLGVLARRATILERLRRLNAVIYDETLGAATGQFQVAQVSPRGKSDQGSLLRYAATAVQGARHPVARAIQTLAKSAEVRYRYGEGAMEEPGGHAFHVIADGRHYMVADGNWLVDQAPLEAQAATRVVVNQQLADPKLRGLRVVFVLRDGKLKGCLGLVEKSRVEAAAAAGELRGLGIKEQTLISSDERKPAEALAAALGADCIHGATPAIVRKTVQKQREDGHRVAIIRDTGRSPKVRTSANTVFALGAAASLAQPTIRRLTILHQQLSRVPLAITLARRTHQLIRFNTLVGIIGMGALIILAGLGRVAPMTVVILHTVGGVILVANSLWPLLWAHGLKQRESAQTTELLRDRYVEPSVDIPEPGESAAEPSIFHRVFRRTRKEAEPVEANP